MKLTRENTLIGEFRIVGLSRVKSITCQTEKQDNFHPNLDNLSQERFDALWKLLEGNWKDRPTALIEYERLDSDGTPINSKFLRVNKI